MPAADPPSPRGRPHPAELGALGSATPPVLSDAEADLEALIESELMDGAKHWNHLCALVASGCAEVELDLVLDRAVQSIRRSNGDGEVGPSLDVVRLASFDLVESLHTTCWGSDSPLLVRTEYEELEADIYFELGEAAMILLRYVLIELGALCRLTLPPKPPGTSRRTRVSERPASDPERAVMELGSLGAFLAATKIDAGSGLLTAAVLRAVLQEVADKRFPGSFDKYAS